MWSEIVVAESVVRNDPLRVRLMERLLPWPLGARLKAKVLSFSFSCLLLLLVQSQAGQTPLLLILLLLVRPMEDGDTYSPTTTTCPGKHIVIRIPSLREFYERK